MSERPPRPPAIRCGCGVVFEPRKSDGRVRACPRCGREPSERTLAALDAIGKAGQPMEIER